ncbi:hypothetical protein V5O48_010551 [Marasmius crinis-equi]|uniref:Uncharacterized protein n=1 Tax=Marasmius crinis-equi TaxID=585013 RepID=A0ABR3F821_9AGAR
MPRPKLYKTKEAKRQAICQKSQRYYHRNGESIKAKKRQKRLDAASKDGLEEERRLSIHQTAEAQQTSDSGIVTYGFSGHDQEVRDRPATAVLFNVQAQYQQLMNPQPALFFDQLFQDLQLWIAANPSAHISQSPMSPVEQKLKFLLLQIDGAKLQLGTNKEDTLHYEDVWRASKAITRALERLPVKLVPPTPSNWRVEPS